MQITVPGFSAGGAALVRIRPKCQTRRLLSRFLHDRHGRARPVCRASNGALVGRERGGAIPFRLATEKEDPLIPAREWVSGGRC